MNICFISPKIFSLSSLVVLSLFLPGQSPAQRSVKTNALELQVGAAKPLRLKSEAQTVISWTSSNPQVVQVFQNGFVVGLKPGQAEVRKQGADANASGLFLITVADDRQPLVDPATLKQYPDNRAFKIGDRKCYGSELNGQRASDPEERRFTHSNRVINPKPLADDRTLEWEVEPHTEIFDGAGILIGTVAPIPIGNRRVSASKFNFGASKVLNGRICVYAFSVQIITANSVETSTSAWLPLDRVLNKEALLERDSLGQAKLPALPLEANGYRVTGGNPKMYGTQSGELSIVRNVAAGPVPSHYLLRPSGTINLIYSVPGFGLGGEGADSFLVSDGLAFYPAKGAKIFVQPTYFPKKHPQAGKVAPQTMTFLYGAITRKGSEPVYGWIVKEALAPTPNKN